LRRAAITHVTPNGTGNEDPRPPAKHRRVQKAQPPGPGTNRAHRLGQHPIRLDSAR